MILVTLSSAEILADTPGHRSGVSPMDCKCWVNKWPLANLMMVVTSTNEEANLEARI